MDKSKLILIIPSAVVLVLLVIHSLRVNGRRTTRNFFFWSMVFCFAKEYINAHSKAPEYMGTGIEIFGVPMMVPVGWCIAIYLSWFVACAMLRRTRLEGAPLPTIALSSVAIMAISLAVECSGGNAKWWSWNYSIPGLWYENPYLKMPIKITGGWATTNLIFMTMFILFEFSPLGRMRKKALVIAAGITFLGATIGVVATNLVLRRAIVAPIVVLSILGFFFVPMYKRKYQGTVSPARAVRRRSGVLESATALRGAASRNINKTN